MHHYLCLMGKENFTRKNLINNLKPEAATLKIKGISFDNLVKRIILDASINR